jgi:hypothetical protein
MALSNERLGEIALLALQVIVEQEDIKFNLKGVKQEIMNTSEKLGISHAEAAEFIEFLYVGAYQKIQDVINSIKASPDNVEE